MKLPRINDHDVHAWGLRENALHWGDLLKRYPPEARSKGNRILLIAAYPWIMSSIVAYAVLLRRLGHHPTVLWMPVTDGIQDPDKPTVAAMDKEFADMTGPLAEVGIGIERLNTLLQIPLPTAFMLKVAEAARRDYLYTYHLDQCDQLADPFFYGFRFQRNLRLACNMAYFLSVHEFDTIINVNGTVNEFGIINAYLAELGLPRYNIEAANVRRVFVSANKPIGMLDMHGAWDHEAVHVYDEDIEASYAALWEQRAGVAYWEEHCVLPLQRTSMAASLPLLDTTGRRLALLCTTVAWDSIALAATSAFKSMLDWVANTIEHVRGHDKLSLIVRVHPAESMVPQGEYTADFLAKRFPELPPHIVVVPPDAPVNTYALMVRADMGLTYMSTSGFEMASRGIPVLTPMCAHYTGKGFAEHAETAPDYFRRLDELADPARDIRLRPDQMGQARCFYEMFFNRVQKKVPWSFQRLEGEYGDPEMEDVLADKDLLGTRATFELLAEPFSAYEGIVVDPRPRHADGLGREGREPSEGMM
ncbi:MAG: hypothetical protein AB7E47_06500 [Desulfovibrionaceae bacterium]